MPAVEQKPPVQSALVVYEMFAGLVFGMARRITGDDETARDVTQEVFVHLWQHPDRVDLSKGTLKAYLGVMAHRRSVDAIRRLASRARTQQLVRITTASAAPSHEDHIVNADDLSQQTARVHEALEALPVEQRTALELAYFQGHTYREVALALDIPEGTAKSRLRLGLTHLRRTLTNDTIKANT
jgi:RNA polymerase sigma-70 factor (ECF subfamily)